MKGGGDKQRRSRLPQLSEPQHRRLRLVSVAAACFLFVLVFLLSSRHEAAVFDTAVTVSSSKASTPENARAPAVRTTRPSPSVAADTSPELGETHGHGRLQRTAGQRNDVPGHGSDAAAVASSSDGRAAPGDMITMDVDPSNQQRQPLCDFSNPRTDVCDFDGDVRLDASASAFLVVDPAGGANGTTTYKVRPYPRKGDATCMGRVTEITVRATADVEAAPRCTTTHAAPAVVFSVGGYAGNLFHDFTDVIVPLCGAAQRFRGDVQLVVTDVVAPRWLARYGALLRELSRHAPLDLAKAAAAGEVHCFRHAVVGLRARRELIVEGPARGADGPATPGFTRFLRRALSLPRDAPTQRAGQKPRLLIVSRRGTRLLLNQDAVARAADEVGFEAVVSDLDAGDGDIARVARLVNSCDAMVGVHGAGLTNMVFLPPGATVVQIVPWGGLRWIARMDFGDPAEAMELRYVQYEVAVGESTLKDKYPRDHEIFTNPTALHKKGFKFMRQTLLNGQDIAVDVHRFRAVLQQALDDLAL